ncbi:aldo/keto reductase [Burkholderia plantarii]|uniref:Oxidoreductase aldo/keto reductase family n=1 Tax=Burkholderia plantarii TaxID=41899 RepID=A0A0B6RZ45_BURPL|nr:aldo/keto reductase [Burkholderia plantarii]AJK48673.1 oxidoreductase aldo/keto reductase family [Burkholderia plantarii]
MKYQNFGRTGVRVSQIVLGTANFGTRWGHGADEAQSAALFQTYAEAGGNFIDTADVYQFGQSEEFIGTLLEGQRDNFFLASKFSSGASPTPDRLTTGNSRKAMVASVEASLKRLKTDRIDLLWVHHPDVFTSSEEIVRGLDDLARAGKILYAGLSNFPAWRLARAVTLAEITRATPIAAAQFEYSLVHREPEADVFVACRALGLATLTWSPLGGGMLTGKYRNGEAGRREAFGGAVFQAEDSRQRTDVLDTVLDVARELQATPDQVAIAWVAAHGGLPLIGPRSLPQLVSNLGATNLTLNAEQLERLDAVSAPAAKAATVAAVSNSNADTELPTTPVA